MKIEYIPIDEITPYANNPRLNDGAVDAVAESIRQFGFKVPVVISADGVIITGHTRIKAAKKLGMTEVPAIRADDLTDEQVKAFRLADNETAELAQWDFELLEQELEGLDGLRNSLEIIGFEFEDDFNLDDFFKPAPVQKQPEEVKTLKEEPEQEEVEEPEPAEVSAPEPVVEHTLAELEATENPEQLVCPYCGHILEPGDLNG